MTWLSAIKTDSSTGISQQTLLSNFVVLLQETSRYINWNRSEQPESPVLTVKFNFFW